MFTSGHTLPSFQGCVKNFGLVSKELYRADGKLGVFLQFWNLTPDYWNPRETGRDLNWTPNTPLVLDVISSSSVPQAALVGLGHALVYNEDPSCPVRVARMAHRPPPFRLTLAPQSRRAPLHHGLCADTIALRKPLRNAADRVEMDTRSDANSFSNPPLPPARR